MIAAEKQAWLCRFLKAKAEIQSVSGELKEQLGRKRELEELLSQPRHPAERRMLERQLAKEQEMIGRKAARLRELELDQQEVAAAIEGVKTPQCRMALEYHYLKDWNWERVACRLGYSYRYIYTIHKKALEEVECKSRKRRYHCRPQPKCRMHTVWEGAGQ